MRVFRSDRGGIGLWKLSGVIAREDAETLLESLKGPRDSNRGCFILDFEKVEHVDFHAFAVLEDGYPEGRRVLLSGLNDYVLGIFAFVTKRNVIPIYPDWRKALRYLVVERGKLGAPTSAASSASE